MRKNLIILPLLLIMVAISFSIAKKGQSYSATDILENADFNVENPTIIIHSVNTDKVDNTENNDIYTQIEIPEETQKKLIQAFQNAKFDKTTINPIEYDFRIAITLNTDYTMYLVSDKKSLTVTSTHENYAIVNDSDFFNILEKATKQQGFILNIASFLYTL